MSTHNIPEYRPDIDGLRALAVLSIIVNHLNKNFLPSGFLGVDIFFVISGFVITGSLVNGPNKTASEFFIGFYTRRIKRLMPALIFSTLMSGILICIVDPNPIMSILTGIFALFGLSNLYLLHISSDYFARSAELNIFTQTWSLGVEEQFYFIYPAFLWFLFANKMTANRRKIFFSLLLASACSLFLFIRYQDSYPNAVFYLMPTRFWELGAGCLLYISGFRPNLHGLPSKKINIFLFIAFCSLLGSLALPKSIILLSTIFTVLVTSLVIVMLRPGNLVFAILTHPYLIYIGKISYSLYLWHWIVLCLSRWTTGISLWTLPFQIILIFFFSVLSYHFIEFPFRRNKSRLMKGEHNVLVGGIGGALLVCILMDGMIRFNHQILYTIQSRTETPPAFLPLKFSQLPFDPTCVVDSNSRPYRNNTFELCTIQPVSSNGQIFWVLGDSHAGHLQGLLYKLHEKLGVGIHLIETPGIPYPIPQTQKFPPRELVMDEILKRSHDSDLIILSRLFIDRETGRPLPNISDWAEDVVKLANGIVSKEIKIIIVGPPPNFQFDNINSCKETDLRRNFCDIDREAISKNLTKVYSLLNEITHRSKNIYIFNQFDVLCPETMRNCAPIKNEKLLYRDKDHLNSYGSASLTEDFTKFLEDNSLLK
jgi:peptidoglycan/LPS O-acetylase OafA/YrhL